MGVDAKKHRSWIATPAMDELTLPQAGLSPVLDKDIVARFDGGAISSDGGLLVLREIERRTGLTGRLADCVDDPRDPGRVQHTLADMIAFRTLMIAAGYEDANDAGALRRDPIFKIALARLPGGADLCSQPTLSRLENLPDVRALIRMGRTMVEAYCSSFRQVPKRIVLDIDDTFDAVHGGQQLRLFNAHHDDYGFQPIVVFDGDGRLVGAILRPAKRPKGREIAGHLRRLIREIRAHWPRVEILLRGDSHYCTPEVLDLCRARAVDFILGVAPNKALRRHITDLEESTAKRFEAGKGDKKVRRFKEFHDAATSWTRVERIIVRTEVGPQGRDTRFIVTSLTDGRGKALYEKLYCRRGQAENHIKTWKTHLAAERTSCSKATANQMRLFLHGAAYWLMWSLRSVMPKRSQWRRAQVDTLRLRLIKVAARVVERKTRVVISLPTGSPAEALMRLALDRLPSLTPG
jgi:hypothetical protein